MSALAVAGGSLAPEGAAADIRVSRLWSPGVGDRRYNLPSDADGSAEMVPGRLSDRPRKAWSLRQIPATGAWCRVSDGVDYRHKLRHGLSEDPTWPIGGYPKPPSPSPVPRWPLQMRAAPLQVILVALRREDAPGFNVRQNVQPIWLRLFKQSRLRASPVPRRLPPSGRSGRACRARRSVAGHPSAKGACAFLIAAKIDESPYRACSSRRKDSFGPVASVRAHCKRVRSRPMIRPSRF